MIFEFLAAASLLVAADAAQAAAPREAPSAARVLAAEKALSAFELGRVLRDRPYAEATLRNIDLLLAVDQVDAPRRLALDSMRALVLIEVDRKEEAKATITRLLAARPAEMEAYILIWAAAAHLTDPKLMVGSIEGMARALGTSDPSPVVDMLPLDMVFGLDSMLREDDLTAERVRLAEALIKIGWQRSDPTMLDSFRVYLVDHHLAQGRRGEAAQLAREVVGPQPTVRLLVARRYDGLVPEGEDLLRQRLEEDDRATAGRLASAPRDLTAINERMAYLRSVGKNEEAVALARPWLADIPATVAADSRGTWIVNDAAFALISLGRADEALAAMRRLAEIDIEAHPGSDLIGPMINFGGMLWHTGRAEESRAFIERLRPIAAKHANQYGRAWVAADAACANAALGRSAEAGAELGQLQGQKVNQEAHNMALLCMGDLDGSERLIIRRLESDDPADMLLPLQRFTLETSAGPGLDAVRKRLDQVRERPAVRAAIERAGRILNLPMNRVYHGSF